MKKDNSLIIQIVSACRKGDIVAQKKLYEFYYGYAMGIALRYSDTREDATEIVNDAFLKVFIQLKSRVKINTFRPWFRRILINTAIDAFRKHKNKHQHLEIVYAAHKTDSYSILDQLSEEEIIQVIQKLSPMYRMVFNLYVLEGYSHKEIATQINIQVSTSKANLSKAKARIRQLLGKLDSEIFKRYG